LADLPLASYAQDDQQESINDQRAKDEFPPGKSKTPHIPDIIRASGGFGDLKNVPRLLGIRLAMDDIT